jgi:protein-disulfide isomerase
MLMRPSREASAVVLLVLFLLNLPNCAPLSSISNDAAIKNASARKAIADSAKELYHSREDLVLGNPSAEIAIVEFFDYNCGYCRKAVPEVSKLLQSDRQTKIIIKELPILGTDSTLAAQAALASAKQGKYRDFHIALTRSRGHVGESSIFAAAEEARLDFTKLKEDMKSEAIAEVLRRNEALARKLEIRGTPTFIIDDKIERRYLSFGELANQVASVRVNGGCRLCQAR